MSDMYKHTPEPWKLVSKPDGYSSLQIMGRKDNPEFPIARVLLTYWPENATDRSNDVDRANAALLTAAPSLLRDRDRLREALRDMLKNANCECDDAMVIVGNQQCSVCKGRSALAASENGDGR